MAYRTRFSLVFLAVSLLVLTAAGRLGAAEEGIAVGVQLDQKAPDFTLPLLDGDGENVNLYEQLQKYDAVFLCFFIVST